MRPHLRLQPTAPAELPRIDAADAVREQVGTAEAVLYDDASAYLHLPWSTLDALVGGIGQGSVWFVGGFSGHGKTTLLIDAVAKWLERGLTVYFLGTETVGHEIRTRLACHRVGIYAGHVLSGASRDWDNWREVRARLVRDIRAQEELGPGQRLLVAPVQRVAAADLTSAFHDAALQQADVLIIDHIDHMAHGQGHTGFEDSRMLSGLVLDLAQSTGLRVIVATQFNNESARANRLAVHQPPQPHFVYMGGHKRQIAWGMLGVYRPLRDDLSPGDLKQARAGDIEPAAYVAPDELAVSIMKHRYYGAHEGRRVRLRFDNGRIEDIPERDRYVTGPTARGPRP
jgi:KaiC/GvpD/RAD55 family RecA-like ATPase